ncbi:MAG: hypothetical protein DRP71_15670 [Verrucomicrobia bacterium]|nr:MAG: hypothetical protein DRP71_15670 [Verrucomicrobiota bacterium]
MQKGSKVIFFSFRWIGSAFGFLTSHFVGSLFSRAPVPNGRVEIGDNRASVQTGTDRFLERVVVRHPTTGGQASPERPRFRWNSAGVTALKGFEIDHNRPSEFFQSPEYSGTH